MKFDVTVFSEDLNASADLARSVEDFGFDGLWVAEAAHNPFLPLAHAALATNRISLGTAIAIAFPRSPMIMAQTAWDLAAQSQGRFILGLGTQIKPHITKRFSAKWGKPVGQLREYIQALRSIWGAFQTGAELIYDGKYYRFSLLSESYARPQMPYHPIPISSPVSIPVWQSSRESSAMASMYIPSIRHDTCVRCFCRHFEKGVKPAI